MKAGRGTIVSNWGATPVEQSLSFPCDSYLPAAEHAYFRAVDPGLEQLAQGQRVMTIFELVEFEPDRHLTLKLTEPRAMAFFGEVAGSYVILPHTERSCRLVVKLLVCYPRWGLWSGMRWILPWGDLLMMRKQLLTLKRLAERPIC